MRTIFVAVVVAAMLFIAVAAVRSAGKSIADVAARNDAALVAALR